MGRARRFVILSEGEGSGKNVLINNCDVGVFDQIATIKTNMKLIARPRRIPEKPINFLGKLKAGCPVGLQQLPEPDYLTIEEIDGGFYLFYWQDEMSQCFADSWYETLELTKQQVERTYGILEDDWMSC